MVASVQLSAGERFVLSGLVVLDGGDGSAWLQEPSLTRNEIVRVRRGDTLGPWRVTRILEDRVELEGPGGSVTYVILGGLRSPDSTSGATARQEAIGARIAARVLATGGDEGVWDDDEAVSAPVPSPPV